MRRNRNRKNDILIDLTSLLDVIFILLMVVLARQQVSGMDLDKQTAILKEEEVELKKVRAETEDSYRLYTEQKNLSDKMVIISVTANFDPENPGERTLRILKNGNDRPDVFTLSGGDTVKEYAAFEEKLKSYVSGSSGMPVILSIADDGSEILYRDEKRIHEIFNGLGSSSDDVYIRALGEEEAK